jgi:hypothetical protein
MLKKAKAGGAGEQAGKAKDISQAVLDSSRQIWLAGLGAFARAQAEGTKVFETLVKQGESLESKTRKAASDTAAMARGAATAKVKEVQKGVGGTGTNSSRYSRIASNARCPNWASTRRTMSSG